jgi:hypothetical protein
LPIDSQVVNGRIIGPDGGMPSSLEVDAGRIISVETETEVWRTVDASGYFVLPGAIQPGNPTSDHALTLINQGISSVLVRLEGGVDELAGEVERLAREAVLDYAICWSLPGDATPEDLMTAREFGVHVFDVSDSQQPGRIVSAIDGATARIPASSEHLSEWVLSAPAKTRFVLTVTSVLDLHDALMSRGSGPAMISVEVDTGSLAGMSGRPLWDAAISGTIDMIATDGPNTSLLQFVYHEGVERRGMSVQRLVDMCATHPATAYGLAPDKGGLQPRSDADFVVFDPAQNSEIGGKTVQGRVIYAQLRGDILLFNDELHLASGNGRMLPAGESVS